MTVYALIGHKKYYHWYFLDLEALETDWISSRLKRGWWFSSRAVRLLIDVVNTHLHVIMGLHPTAWIECIFKFIFVYVRRWVYDFFSSSCSSAKFIYSYTEYSPRRLVDIGKRQKYYRSVRTKDFMGQLGLAETAARL